MIDVVARKLSTFVADPLGSAKSKGLREVQRLLCSQGQRKLRDNGALDALAMFLQGRPANAIAPNFADLWFLYQNVRRRKPRVVLEFGSGCSTVILAHALYQNATDDVLKRGFLYSVDADPQWAAIAKGSIPGHLQKICNLSYSPLIEVEHNGTPGYQHEIVPDVIPDFLYLDGPGLTAEREVAVDVLILEEKFPREFFMVVDGRTKNTLFLKQHLKRNYRFTENKLLFSYVFELDE